MFFDPLFATDSYKTDHRRQYPNHTTEVYSNLTPRHGHNNIKEIIFFGLQYVLKEYFIHSWNIGFFQKEKHDVVRHYQERMQVHLGIPHFDVRHIAALHDLGYLPLRIKALEEGERVPVGIPLLTLVNTHPDFFWLTNYVETALLSFLWKPITVATIAGQYREILMKYAKKTGANEQSIAFSAHDFSFRGLTNVFDAMSTGGAHLISFSGTDTLVGIDFLRNYYDANSREVGFSVPASEHSVMSMGTRDGELETFRRLIEDVYPTGIVSIVSDTWDFWHVIGHIIPMLKNIIISRKGKVVIRPDSGDPLKIICGDESMPKHTLQHKGAIGCLWDIFGGSQTSTGHRLLDNHIGLIYGDSVTLKIAEDILCFLDKKGFSSENIVFGIGGMSYQSITRDFFGFAVKATSGVVNGQRRIIYKAPCTAPNGEKTSLAGLLHVEKKNGTFRVYDRQTEEEEKTGALKIVFENGKIVHNTNFQKIRSRLWG